MSRFPLLIVFLFLISFSLNAQCVQGDCFNGKGTFVYPSGTKYTGQFKNGEIHGEGTCDYVNGTKYSGQWVQRYPEGYGIKTYPDGSRREGQWLRGQPINTEGQILQLAAKGNTQTTTAFDVQSGCVQGNCEAGHGVYVYIDGSRYEGEFNNGKLHGQGTWHYPDGEKYIGGFKNNYSHGLGAIYHLDGTQTNGEWVNGEFQNLRPTNIAEEGCIEGDCQNGIGTYIYEGGSAKYVGSFRNEIPEGTGTCYYANGEKYEGQWRNGSFNGNGTLFMLDGSKVNGFWEDGTYIEKPTKKPITPPSTTAVTPMPQERETKVWAVLVGVSNYEHMPALKYTDDDAYRVFAHLRSPEGGALNNDQIKILIDEDATLEKIKSTMSDVFSKAGSNDLVMLYFSGHGLNGSFLPIDFDGYNNKLLHEDINAILEQSPAKYKICIADACHSGSMYASRGTVTETLDKYYRTLAQAKGGTALILSSKSTETSLESSGLRQGVFSHFLIRGLRGEADLSTDGIVTIDELYSYIYQNVRSYTGMRQSPVMLGEFDDNMAVSAVRD